MQNQTMKVLFVASGNKNGEPGAVVKNQADTLKKAGIQVDFYLIRGKGLKGYLRNVYPLCKYLKKAETGVIHSHYSLSALVTSMALFLGRKRPHVVSLMGSDAKIKGIIKTLVKICHTSLWDKTIVKSHQMAVESGLENTDVIPNGVDIKKIEAIDNNLKKSDTQGRVDQTKNTVLFAADPSRESKNYPLADKAVRRSSGKSKVIYDQPHETVLAELLKADVLLLTSRWEGSPNLVKEAMACNCPVVSTNVGDVEWLFGDEPGHFLTTFDPEDVAQKIDQALEFSRAHGRTQGRDRILALGLDAENVAERLVGVYGEALER